MRPAMRVGCVTVRRYLGRRFPGQEAERTDRRPLCGHPSGRRGGRMIVLGQFAAAPVHGLPRRLGLRAAGYGFRAGKFNPS